MAAELRRLTRAVQDARPLVDVLRHPVRLAGPPGLASLLGRVTRRLGAPDFALDDRNSLDTFERLVSDHLALRDGMGEDLPPAVIDEVVDGAAQDGFEGLCVRDEVEPAGGGPPLPAYTAGDPASPAVVIVSACGMPARLCEQWIRFLSRTHHVITWETRDLFALETPRGPDPGTRADDPAPAPGARAGGLPDAAVMAQAGDLFAVMDHFGVRRAHLMGLCGGAVVGLAAAHLDPGRVDSLSLWHGDFAAMAGADRTHHQQNLAALMEMGATAPDRAAAVHPVLCQTMLSSVPPDLAHLVVYPYATPGLLHRYCRLNGEIMSTDVSPWLPGLDRPVLVVTSQDDETAHPAGSKAVAGALPDSILHVRAHGDHISLFKGDDPELMNMARDFIDSAVVR
ncbi:alpha/beta hydrolase [Nonomuraea sp. WAC 01424]|uniref:alpha/beta fold hydrolase n=1 Tax=Nonomuraea sp. WAC 01424 TaxID=2203200 RepID=UPI000F76C963|nr:alpha/beta fold hydrolase [Nonomuraea sp. WAC 01424]RSM99124.1 alpha/beta hydrolase [Nonomuraea sp. WAC 01424]